MYKSRSPLYDEDDTVAHRMEAVTALGRLLQQTATISSDKASAQRQLYRQVRSLPAALQTIRSALISYACVEESQIRCSLSVALRQAYRCRVHACLTSRMLANARHPTHLSACAGGVQQHVQAPCRLHADRRGPCSRGHHAAPAGVSQPASAARDFSDAPHPDSRSRSGRGLGMTMIPERMSR